MERGSERFAGMVVVPDASGGLVRWLVGRAVDPERTPRFQALPGPKPVLGMGRLGPAPSWTVVAEGVFDWLSLTGWGLPAVAAAGGLVRPDIRDTGIDRGRLFGGGPASHYRTRRLRAMTTTMHTPWGPPQDIEELAEGVWRVSTPATAG